MIFRDAVYKALESPRYDALMGRSVDFREMFFDWLGRLLVRLLDMIDINLADGSGINTALVANIFLFVGGVLIAVAAFVLIRAYLRYNEPEEYALYDMFDELYEERFTVQKLMELSRNAHDRRVSVRYLYIAALLSLNEKNIIRIEPSATNGIILRQIRQKAPTLLEAFSQTADTFHKAWFGNKNVSNESYQRFTRAVNMLVGVAHG